MPSDRKQWAQTETQEVPSEHQEKLFYTEGYQALAQVALRGGGVSLLGEIQKPFGHGPGLQVALLEWGGGLDKVTSRGPFQPQPFCDPTPPGYCIDLWSPQHKKDMDLLEQVERRATKMVRDGTLLL
ncbi:hypothetical protein QYF61_000300 [Mycteria americana]|uniref:Uncharacterized protein n=1 Tax=Mycteria americana TaxID=33587 RepID=A0AAN7P9G9_MYCAM|nr:hypothetical protein QYF61_000300 [Mycteria americana]